jgi:hypothetical protein
VRHPVVPHHPIHHNPTGGGRGGPVHKKPLPPGKAHKKPKPAKKPKKPPAKKPARKWSPGWDVACCSAEAVGLLLGFSDAEVLELYWATADDPDEGASIEDTLGAAWPGLGSLHPASRRMGAVPGHAAGLILGIQLAEPHAVAVTPDGTWWSWGQPWQPPPGLIIDEAWAVLLCQP